MAERHNPAALCQPAKCTSSSQPRLPAVAPGAPCCRKVQPPPLGLTSRKSRWSSRRLSERRSFLWSASVTRGAGWYLQGSAAQRACSGRRPTAALQAALALSDARQPAGRELQTAAAAGGRAPRPRVVLQLAVLQIRELLWQLLQVLLPHALQEAVGKAARPARRRRWRNRAACGLQQSSPQRSAAGRLHAQPAV